MRMTPNNSEAEPAPLTPASADATQDRAQQLLERARADTDAVLKALGSELSGLNEAEADARWKQVGSNEIAREKRQSALMRLLANVKNPLVRLLLAPGVLSFLTGDQRATVVIFVMVVMGVVLRFFQEMRADNAAAQLQAIVSNTATLVRDGKEKEVSLKMLVPGDIIRLAAGDMVPADVRVLSAKDLFLNQVALTGEALPVEKKAAPASGRRTEPAGASQHLLPRLQRAERIGDGGSHPHRGPDVLRFLGRQYRRAAPVDQLRQGHQQIHLADDLLHRRDGSGGVSH